MKIHIKRGTSVEKAMESVGKFLQEYCGEYPVLKGDFNLYLTLKDSQNRVSPYNDKEFVLSADNVIDIEKEKKQHERTKLINNWNNYVAWQAKRLDMTGKAVEKDELYLNTAKEKGRKHENIQKRIKEYEKHKKELVALQEEFDLLDKLTTHMNEHGISTFCRKTMSRKSSYDYDLDMYLVFRNVDGFTGYFWMNNKAYFSNPCGFLEEGDIEKLYD